MATKNNDMRRKENNPLAGTGTPANPKATQPPKTHEQLKNHSSFVKQQKGQR